MRSMQSRLLQSGKRVNKLHTVPCGPDIFRSCPDLHAVSRRHICRIRGVRSLRSRHVRAIKRQLVLLCLPRRQRGSGRAGVLHTVPRQHVRQPDVCTVPAVPSSAILTAVVNDVHIMPSGKRVESRNDHLHGLSSRGVPQLRHVYMPAVSGKPVQRQCWGLILRLRASGLLHCERRHRHRQLLAGLLPQQQHQLCDSVCSVQSRLFQLLRCVDKLHPLPTRVDIGSRSTCLYTVSCRHLHLSRDLRLVPFGVVRTRERDRDVYSEPVGLLHNAERDGDPPLRCGAVSDGEQHVRQLREGVFQLTGEPPNPPSLTISADVQAAADPPLTPLTPLSDASARSRRLLPCADILTDRSSVRSQPGATSCSVCASGSVALPGQASCIPCQASTFANLTSALCQPCPPSQFSLPSSTSCSSCPPGSILNVSTSACVGCQAGQFLNSSLSACQACPANQYSASVGASSCAFAPPGFYTVNGSTAIVNCPAGQYLSTISGTCAPCGAATFSAQSGASYCTPCASGSIAPPGARSRLHPSAPSVGQRFITLLSSTCYVFSTCTCTCSTHMLHYLPACTATGPHYLSRADVEVLVVSREHWLPRLRSRLLRCKQHLCGLPSGHILANSRRAPRYFSSHHQMCSDCSTALTRGSFLSF